MNYRSYQHIERYGTDEVENIQFGRCYIFYKIDGTNASIWLGDGGNLEAGSRKRQLSLESDNAGFYNWAINKENLIKYLNDHPTHRLYGEWLVPHSLKTYRQDAWRRFYVFDVVKELGDDKFEYLPYDIYQPLMEEYGLDYIPPVAIISNPTDDQLYKLLEKTGQFLVEDGKGNGEGIVIKNYDFYNKYHRQTWAKIVCAEFKEKHAKEMGAPEMNGETRIEQRIVDEFCTPSFIQKEYEKIVNVCGGWKSEYIPRLLHTVFAELIREETFNFVKKFKMPTINFKTLNALVIQETKKEMSHLFN